MCTRKLILKKSETKLNNDEIGIMALHFHLLAEPCLLVPLTSVAYPIGPSSLARDRGSSTRSVDSFIEEKLKKNGLQLSPKADGTPSSDALPTTCTVSLPPRKQSMLF